MGEDMVISALIGLVRACNNNPKTANTDSVVLKALAFTAACPELDSLSPSALVEEIHREKFTVAPGCAQCASPCGNTSDYDMDLIYGAEEDIRSVKLRILSQLRETAAYLYCRQENGSSPAYDVELFYKALSYVSYDLKMETLSELLQETSSAKQKIITNDSPR